MTQLTAKTAALRRQLRGYESLLIAYSGGVDSALLLRVAHDELGEKVLAVTADSPSVARRELEIAKRIAHAIGARHRIIRTGEFDNTDYVQNPTNRCYFCKTELYTKLMKIAAEESIHTIANGTNVDDLGDFRPGLQAADEFRVVSPLRDAGFSKQDVRALARQLGLEIWDKPASPCLSSRIPYGSAVTPEKLAVVEAAEDFLRKFGIRELRVRHFGSRARIETAVADQATLARHQAAVKAHFHTLGFAEIEWREFRSGALNAVQI